VNPQFALIWLPIKQVLNPILIKGDNYKFLHAREDYKQVWQLDREWENVTRGKKNIRSTRDAIADKDNAQEEEDEKEDVTLDSIPFACIICKESYKAPIATRCATTSVSPVR
jgi:RING finger protein 113A